MPAEKRSPDDVAGASTGALGGAALGALSGGGDALLARRPAARLPVAHSKQLRQRAPGGGPAGDSNVRSHADRGTVGE